MVFFPHQCANIGPADYNYDETISTLRYANRAKNIKNKARINEDPKDALLRQFQKEIEELKKKLEEGEMSQTFIENNTWIAPFMEIRMHLCKTFAPFKVKRSPARRAADQRRWMKVMMKEQGREKAAGEEGVSITV